MKKLPLLIILIIFVSPVFAQKNYTSDKVVFLPQEFYVGDLVEMRVVITPDPGVTVIRPERFPDSYWVKIENAEVNVLDGEYELRIFLRPYAPGIRTLPGIQFGDVLLRDIRIQTVSMLADEALPLSPPAGQILLPGTRYYIALIVGVVFLLPVFFIFFWTKLRNNIHAYVIERRRRRPYRRLLRVLKELQDSMHELKGREFYTKLIDELRQYLTARGSIDYESATVREASAMIDSDFSGSSASKELASLLRFADEVKFGGRRVMIRRREEDLVLLTETASEIEEAAGGSRVNL
ncbi:MAG TPA: hypothetical protein DCO79_00855 [Spirochaeta sp.]|nr:hypothetical protein [Spirochaeta sp.]